ncbi:MAG: hypothetical protein HZC15_01750 [Candidatus Omnitrophica bacterium]|nr:hypothetical protein [Candidatus Omnitrophota bacterium]
MPKKRCKNSKGVALIIVLGVLLVITILANVILSLISSQSRVSYHQLNRIRAYYACLAGMNLAVNKLRTNTWTANQTYFLGNCSGARCTPDADIPYLVTIAIGVAGTGIAGTTPINITTDYTLQ